MSTQNISSGISIAVIIRIVRKFALRICVTRLTDFGCVYTTIEVDAIWSDERQRLAKSMVTGNWAVLCAVS